MSEHNQNKKLPLQIGLNIKAARLDRALTLEELGLRIGKTKQEVHYIEQGNDCKGSIYYTIAQALQMEMHELAAYHLVPQES